MTQQLLSDCENNIIHRPGKVFIAVSGGVDSAVAAAMLLEAGFSCTAVYMKLYDQPLHKMTDAERVAKQLGMPFEVLDLTGEFKSVIDYFCSRYKQARTPNPCMFCNRYIKFGRLFEYAREKGADFLATGHYARIVKESGSFSLYSASDSARDQSYFLAMIDKAVLKNIIFPVGRFDKNQTRTMANKSGLAAGSKPDSQEICFIPDNNYAAVLESLCPELARPGNIIDSSGNVLGTHNGIHNYTIGQRRGLGIAMGVPWYVTRLDAEQNTVTLGPEQQLLHRKFYAAEPNWLIDRPCEPFAALIKTRYNNEAVSGYVYPDDGMVNTRNSGVGVNPVRDEDGMNMCKEPSVSNGIKVVFDRPVGAVTPGQAAVFYLKNEKGLKVAGAAWIEEVFD